jgi:hypothetical protein
MKNKELSLSIISKTIYRTISLKSFELNNDIENQVLSIVNTPVNTPDISTSDAIAIRDTFSELVLNSDLLILQNNTSGNLENMLIDSANVILQHVFEHLIPHIVSVVREHFQGTLSFDSISNHHFKDSYSKAIAMNLSNIYNSNSRLQIFLVQIGLINIEYSNNKNPNFMTSKP